MQKLSLSSITVMIATLPTNFPIGVTPVQIKTSDKTLVGVWRLRQINSKTTRCFTAKLILQKQNLLSTLYCIAPPSTGLKTFSDKLEVQGNLLSKLKIKYSLRIYEVKDPLTRRRYEFVLWFESSPSTFTTNTCNDTRTATELRHFKQAKLKETSYSTACWFCLSLDPFLKAFPVRFEANSANVFTALLTIINLLTGEIRSHHSAHDIVMF